MNTTSIHVSAWGKPVGTLTDSPQGIAFKYSPEALQAKISYSPLSHPAIATTFKGSRVRGMYGLPSFIADSLPDSFGRRVMQTFFESKGLVNPSPLQLLALVGAKGMGALTFTPATAWDTETTGAIDKITLARSAREAVAVFDQLNKGLVNPLLLQEGSSIGGARPKMRLCIAPDGTLHGSTNPPAGSTYHILKFDAHNRGWGAVEYAYSLMARDAGISMPATALQEVQSNGDTLRCFRIERFDIREGVRQHYASVSGLLNVPLYASADGETPNDYTTIHSLIKRMAKAGHPLADAREQLFRRCVFNFAAHNADDHFKNFGLLMSPNGRWEFSPAFDLCFTDPSEEWVRTGGRCTGLFDKFKSVTGSDLIKFGRQLMLPENECAQTVERITATVSRWKDYADKARVPDNLAELIESTTRGIREKMTGGTIAKPKAIRPRKNGKKENPKGITPSA